MTRGKLIKIVASLTATGVALYFLFSQVSLETLKELPDRLDLRYLGLAFVFYLLANYARALRYRLLLGNRIGTRRLLEIVIVQNFFNTFLPLRAGEVSYLVMVHQSGTVTPGANVASLLGARLLDFVFALLIPLGALPLSAAWQHDDPQIRTLATLAVAVAVGIVAFTALGIWQSERIALRLERRAARGTGRFHRGLRHGADAVRALGELRSGRVLVPVLLLSFACWFLLYMLSATILKGTGLSVSIADGAFVNGFPALAAMTPLYMFGGFGLFEGSVAFGLTLVGVRMEDAVAPSLLAHVAELMLIAVPALPVWLLVATRARRTPPSATVPD